MKKEFVLKTVISLVVFGALFGCASTPKDTSIQIVNAIEILGRNGAQYQGRLLKIESNGNEFTKNDTVRENALIRATWETYQLGYDYFMIFSEDNNSERKTYTTSGSATTRYNAYGSAYTTYTPGYAYNSTNYSVIIIILPCYEKELLDNIPTFKVSSRLSEAKTVFSDNLEKAK